MEPEDSVLSIIVIKLSCSVFKVFLNTSDFIVCCSSGKLILNLLAHYLFYLRFNHFNISTHWKLKKKIYKSNLYMYRIIEIFFFTVKPTTLTTVLLLLKLIRACPLILPHRCDIILVNRDQFCDIKLQKAPQLLHLRP